MSLFSLGSLMGALFGGPLSDWAGRRATLVVGALFAALGIIVESSSIAIWQVDPIKTALLLTTVYE